MTDQPDAAPFPADTQTGQRLDVRDGLGKFLNCPGPGRPRGTSSQLTELKRLITQAADDATLIGIAKKMVELALDGDIAAASWVYDRLYGRPRQFVDLEATMSHVGPDHPSTVIAGMLAEIQAAQLGGE